MIHFKPVNAIFTYCGEPPALDLKTTADPRRVTCPRCQAALAYQARKRRKGR